MPRHPPIALKTLDRSHCQYPPRDLEEIVASAKSCAGLGLMSLAQKDQLLEIGSRVRLGKPIICGRLSVSPRQTRAFNARSAERSKPIGDRTQAKESEQIFSLRCQTEQAVDLRSAAKPFANDFHPLNTRYGGAGRDRTDDILLAKQALSQLSYGP
jgi:hypothetical protein